MAEDDTLEPGRIEVEFEDSVRPETYSASSSAPMAIRSPSGVDLSAVNAVLQQHHLTKAEPSIHTEPDEAERTAATFRKQGADVPNYRNLVTFEFPADEDVRAIAAELTALPQVRRAVAVPKAIPPQTPLDEPLVGVTDQVVVDPVTGYENQWYIFRCGANHAWNHVRGANVVIADIDWGYRTTHEDLAARLDLTRAYNSYDGSNNVSHGAHISHGTAVMGIAGGDDNDRGMAGFAHGATLWPVQANGGPGTPLPGNAWANAIEWVRTADSGGQRKVIILEVQTGSYGNYEMVPSVNAAIRAAIASGVVVCVAAGNGDRDAGLDDAGNAIPETGSILVGATQYHPVENRRAWFSNYADRIVVAAPGDPSHDITADIGADDDYRNGFGGTSGATPKVAGAVALMLEANPALTHAEIRDILRDTGTPVVTDPGKPVGVFLDADAAVRAVRGATGALYRYWNPTIGDHFYTTDWSELGSGGHGWSFESIQCYVYLQPRPGTVPLYRYWNPNVGDHFYTTDWSELGNGAFGWIFEHVECYVDTGPSTGRASLYRYWNPTIGDHFYTTNFSELGHGGQGWTYEGVQCYVRTQPALTTSVVPARDVETVAIPETFRVTARNGRSDVPQSFRSVSRAGNGAPRSDSFRTVRNGEDDRTPLSFHAERDPSSGRLTLTIDI